MQVPHGMGLTTSPITPFRKGSCTQALRTWNLGNSNYSTGLGQVCAN